MTILIGVLILFIAGAVWWKKRSGDVPADAVLTTSMDHFHASGDRVRAHDLLQRLPALSRECLRQSHARFVLYPNERIVALCGSAGSLYCYCNFMEYMDLTKAIEMKMDHNKDPEPDAELTDVASKFKGISTVAPNAAVK